VRPRPLGEPSLYAQLPLHYAVLMFRRLVSMVGARRLGTLVSALLFATWRALHGDWLGFGLSLCFPVEWMFVKGMVQQAWYDHKHPGDRAARHAWQLAHPPGPDAPWRVRTWYWLTVDSTDGQGGGSGIRTPEGSFRSQLH
jgi:hypothetical protein